MLKKVPNETFQLAIVLMGQLPSSLGDKKSVKGLHPLLFLKVLWWKWNESYQQSIVAVQ